MTAQAGVELVIGPGAVLGAGSWARVRRVKRYRLPQKLVEQAQGFAAGTAVPAEPKDAATVVLLRDGEHGPEVYLLKRQTSMAFAGGFAVFPGGGVDPRDNEPIEWAGPSLSQWATWLDTSEDHARSLVCAAVRETFEESGVLLAGPSADSVVSDTSGDDWEADRVALEARELSLTEFLKRRGLVLRSDLLSPFAAWLTPVFEPRRYRTWFLAAQLPEGQITRDVSSESSSVEWLPAAVASRQVDAGELMMMPPTWMSCVDVERFETAAAVVADPRPLTMFTPTATEEDGLWVLSIPPFYRDLVQGRMQ